VTVLSAVDLEEMKFFKSINEIEKKLDMINRADEASRSSNTWERFWNRMQGCFCRKHSNETAIENPSLSNEFSAPSQCVAEIQLLRRFLSLSFSESFLDTLFTILVFEHMHPVSRAPSSELFLSKMRKCMNSFKSSCRAMNSFQKMIEETAMLTKKKGSFLSRSLHKLFFPTSTGIFETFSRLSLEQVQNMIRSSEFQDVQDSDLPVTSIRKLVDLKLRSLDIEGGFRSCRDEMITKSAVHEPNREMSVSRPKVIASAVHRHGIEQSMSSLVQASAVVTLSSALFHQQGLTDSTDETLLQGFQDLSVNEGDRYVGNFDKGLRSGEGKYEWQCGDTYEGLWCDDERNGFGILKCKSGNIYKGEWLRGQRSGWGEMSFCDGSTFRGEWWNDRFCGNGVYKFADGRCLQGDWADCILIEEHHVDIPHALKTQLNEKQRIVCQSNSDTQDKFFQTKQATEMFREKSLMDLLFCTTLNHSPMSSSSVCDIKNKIEHQGYLRQLLPDKSNNWGDVGGKLVSSLSDAYSKNMSEASEAASRAQLDNDIIFALQNENASLAGHNQLLKLQLKQLSKSLADSHIDQHTQLDSNDHGSVEVDVLGQESLILDLRKQIQIMTCENDVLLQELSHEDCVSSEYSQSEATLISLSHQVETITTEVSSIKALMMRLRTENADLTAKSRFIDDQNKSFQNALKFRSSSSYQQRQ
jgi:hypothetical protein